MPRNYLISLISTGLPNTVFPQVVVVYAEDEDEAIAMANLIACRLDVEMQGTGCTCGVDFVEVI